MLSALSLFALINLGLSPYLQIVDIGTVAGHTLVFIFVWFTANASGVYLSCILLQRVKLLSQAISSDTSMLGAVGNLPQQALVELEPILTALINFKIELDLSLEEATKTKAIAAVGIVVATQVSHDIQSPLTALEMVLLDLGGIAEDRRILIRNAKNRIKDIANSLLQKNRDAMNATSKTSHDSGSTEAKTPCLISSLLESVATEKRMQFRENIGIEIHLELNQTSYGAFALVQPTEQKRLISNLVNNAAEAIIDNGTVELSLISGHSEVAIKSWGGDFQIESSAVQGTSLILTLPRIQPPTWFVAAIEISEDTTIVVLDDDSLIHSVWTKRIRSSHPLLTIEVFNFSTPDQLRIWHSQESERK